MSSYLMLKMFKRNREKNNLLKNQDIIQNEDRNSLRKIKSTTNKLCRICLKDGKLPVYGTENSFNVAEAIKFFGGIEISDTDRFPKYLCETCYSLLKGAVLFRKNAQQSEKILKQVNIWEDDVNDHVLSLFSEVNDSHSYHNGVNFKCKTCKLIFKSWDNYINHRKSKHKNIRIQCPVCNRLLTRSLYKKHLARHKSASHLVCDVCGKLYRKDNLIRHLQLHSYELPFQCQVCPYRGRFLESLKTHMHTHTGYKPFSCDKCNLRFLTKSNLNRHLFTHGEEKPFNCMECNRGFYTKRDMEVHFKSDHAGIKDFSCVLCGNKYGTRKALMRHELRVHKRVKMTKGRVPLYLQDEYMRSNDLVCQK